MFKAMGLAVVLVALGAGPSFAAISDCSDPIAPAAINGNAATKEQIHSALEDVKSFLKQSDDYQVCLLKELDDANRQAKKDKKDPDPALDADVRARIQANQTLKERVGAEFNAAAQAFNAKHPG